MLRHLSGKYIRDFRLRTINVAKRGTRTSEPDPNLESVCRTAAQLAATMGNRLRHLRVQSGETWIEADWSRAPMGQLSSIDKVFIASGPNGDTASPARLHYIRSPMVGTFYHAPEPGGQPFVGVGDALKPGQPVGIIEAMKLMNQIEADRPGEVAEILVADRAPVEYDQPLISLVVTQPSATAEDRGSFDEKKS